MGNEARCRARYGDEVGEVKALLETKELVLRGALRAVIPFEQMKQVSAEGGALRLTHQGRKLELSLGPRAAKWAEKIKSPRSRIDKLGIKAGEAVLLLGVTDRSLEAELRGRGAELKPGKGPCAAIFLQVAAPKDLGRLKAAKARLLPDGALWLIRPKGAGALVSERAAMAAGKAAGLVDVKVVAFSETHTAEKYVIPVADR
jgi:hypothetical protein